MCFRLLILLTLLSLPSAAAETYTVLAVFAHPDDESSVGPLLAKYAAEGHEVHLVTITSGQIGDGNTGIPKGDQLGAAREAEARCSAEALGIREPHLLQFMDGSISTHEALPRIVQRLRAIFNEVRPDVVITWGPDGLTGHPDHRTASAVTTQVFQQRGLLDAPPRKLYYTAWPESQLDKEIPGSFGRPGAVRAVSDEYVTTVIEAGEYVDQAYESVKCHETQWTPEVMASIHTIMEKVNEGRVYLRLALSDIRLGKKKESSVFEGL